MSTRSMIWQCDEKGNYRAIYCQIEGYPSHNGLILYTFYNTTPKVNKLINLGNISSLGVTIGVQVDYERHRSDRAYYEQTKYQCLAYHRDNGEELTILKCSKAKFEETFLAHGQYVDYNYLWLNNQWYYVQFDKQVGKIVMYSLKEFLMNYFEACGIKDFRCIPVTDKENVKLQKTLKELYRVYVVLKKQKEKYLVLDRSTNEQQVLYRKDLEELMKQGYLIGKQYRNTVRKFSFTE